MSISATSRIKVLFYSTGGNGERMLRKGGCKVTFTTLEDYKRKISPTLYDTIVHDLEKCGAYNTNTHRVKLI